MKELKKLHLQIRESDTVSPSISLQKIKNIISSTEKSFYKQVSEYLLNVSTKDPNQNLIKDYLIKPISDSCNLRCTYCYESGEHYKGSSTKMSIIALELIIKDILRVNTKTAKFTWHGGEPLMLGIKYFEKIIELQKQHNVNNCEIVNMIQSNGVLLNHEWYEFIGKNRIYLSISLDGVKTIHDTYRFDVKGVGTYETVLEKIKELQQNFISFHIISVINNEYKGLANEYYKTIVDNNILSFDIHPNFKNQSNFIIPKVFSDFVKEVFDLWLIDPIERDCILFTDFLKSIVTGKQETCYFSGRCSEIVAVDGNGDYIPCTRPFDKLKHSFGNVNNINLDEIESNTNFVDFVKSDKSAVLSVNSCKWNQVCNNGCPQHRIKDGLNNIEGHSVFCNCNDTTSGGYFAVWEHISQAIYNLTYEIE